LNFIIPLGISYITFQAIGYLIDIFRNEQRAELNLGYFSTFILYFPKIVSGPVERAGNFLPQLVVNKKFDYDLAVNGLRLFLWGFFKKVIIADRIGLLVDSIYSSPDNYGSFTVIIVSCLFTIQLYADFSGYTDMAIGTSNILGIRLMENFNIPFIAKSTTELWRRWHISLSTWFNEYVFKPLSINLRKLGPSGIVISLLITFMLLGLWHGAGIGFIAFGLIQGILLSIETISSKWRKKVRKKIPSKINNIIGISYTFIAFSFALVFLKLQNVSKIKDFFASFFTEKKTLLSCFNLSFSKLDFIILVISVSFMLFVEYFNIQRNFSEYFIKRKYIRYLVYFFMILFILFFGIFNNNQFIYNQF
jgi:D-alanyl-lipoteichoic acid acyltransferase DltB (MBOAT superfamily)